MKQDRTASGHEKHIINADMGKKQKQADIGKAIKA